MGNSVAQADTTIFPLLGAGALGFEWCFHGSSQARLSMPTIFYSWQSDTPSNVNRGFIAKALRSALDRLKTDAALESALRDTEVSIDKDTQGIAGSPPIVETILRKIEECAAQGGAIPVLVLVRGG